MKKTKLPGDNISLKTKKTEDPLVMQWLNMQTNLMDSLRYLVENEIMLNGVRNLQAFVPMERNMLQGSPALQQPSEYRPHAAGMEQMAAAAEDAKDVEIAEEAPAAPAFEPVIDEEIDDDDIEAWS
ncbi:hypothetical protein [Paenibacillus sp. Soil522]|uniref:hypothetical protein n=1 Tax=Paenibacillus sp. Soil522 TaxID=1736388 RepID=UPI0006F67B22|nr:hypothetical protein [Paenibacillus sp. Soil522]KRE53592.1 hypothetical protein ASG81_02200 [Paenibacillus sp. Soil522]